MSDKVVHLTESSFESEVIKSDIPVLVDFYAEWCGPCKMVAPILDVLAEKFDGKVKICKINIDNHKKIAIDNKVMSIPTMFFYKNGDVIERVVGALPQPAIESKLNGLI